MKFTLVRFDSTFSRQSLIVVLGIALSFVGGCGGSGKEKDSPTSQSPIAASTNEPAPQTAPEPVAEPPRVDTAKEFDELLRTAKFAEAESLLKSAIEQNPDDITARRLMAQMLSAQGRRIEASYHVRHLIRLRVIQHYELLSLIDLSGPFGLVNYGQMPGMEPDTLFGLGEARRVYFSPRADVDEVLSMLMKVRRQHPDHSTVVALTGRVLAENARWSELQEWISELPEDVKKVGPVTASDDGIAGVNRPMTLRDEPEFWIAIGLWLDHGGLHEEAVNAWTETLRRDPTNRAALRLIVSTTEKHLPESSRWSKELPRLRQWIGDLDKVFRLARDADAKQAAWIAERMQSWFRPWESSAWTMRVAQLTNRVPSVVPELDQRRESLLAWENQATEFQTQQARLKRSMGFTPNPFEMPALNESIAMDGATDDSSRPPLVFQDVAAELGIDTEFTTGYPADGKEFYLHQANGVGLAALDYDLDGRCDTYFARAGGDPNKLNSLQNQLYRQLPSGQFSEVTELCRADDRGFSQGICVGDVNQDGFPDILVANIGRNGVYINQGDGTFQIDPQLINGSEERWTSSLGLADLNGDALPDLVEINYIDDPLAFEVMCSPPFDNCQPQSYRVCQDYVYEMQPDGSLSPWQSVCDAMAERPKLGFGVIIGNFDDRCGNDFFVSNDGDLNHFWVSQCSEAPASAVTGGSSSDTRTPSITTMNESAGLAGCAVGRSGIGEACMGIAAGDFNRDGRLDLHVTNFYQESVNLFMQTAGGFFADEALAFGLDTPSRSTTGFGTQAADFDNDGWLDLAVLNGHLFNNISQSVPFRMLPQLFRGGARGFVSEQPQTGGFYFESEQIGRTLATLDYNTDGRVDLLANHLDQPAALLMNDTPSKDSIQLEFIGKTSERAAVGAVVQVSCEAENESLQLTDFVLSGGGYMSTSQGLLHIGLGEIKGEVTLNISWPSGLKESIESLQPNKRYQILETSGVINATRYAK
ncbi:FG-GAP-like repeat-containing protein [Rhodopirellula europaea]|uniref:ASPIC/UnbV domain-containing protein n=1 Tax=Rhodopirellula europaea 6C TaxID=1263867 RepID=M2A6V9_9BACT|nr:FG-GAP-like repeat-containing protein [Rhodopirellula europaea]EMB16736.1 ASPIC/UnbV domain-containing protein [Rhodopirellula europaea 6C]